MIALPMIMLAPAVSARAPAPSTSVCRPAQLRLALDARDGDFGGMSHSGILVMLTNRSGRACAMPALPVIAFRDARGRLLPIARQRPVGMHPGPVLLPVRVAPHAVVSTPLRWVSGDVFDPGRCFTPARLTVAIAGRRLGAAIVATICGPAGTGATFEQPALRPGTSTSGE